MRTLFLNIGAIGVLLIAVSCASRIGFEEPLPPDPPTPPAEDMVVRIVPEWNSSVRPARINALFYSTQGALYKEISLPLEGGQVTVPKDSYRVLVCNPDAERVVFSRMERFETASGRVTLVSKAEGQPIESPGALFSTVCEVLPSSQEVHSLMVPRSVAVTIKLKAQDASLEGGEVSVRLRNVADGINLSTGLPYHTSESDFTVSQLSNQGVLDGAYTFTGSAFGCCVKEGCSNPSGHEIYSDVAVTAPDGTVKTVSVDITQVMKEAQQTVTEVKIEIAVKPLVVGAEVTGWTTGAASGGINGEVR